MPSKSISRILITEKHVLGILAILLFPLLFINLLWINSHWTAAISFTLNCAGLITIQRIFNRRINIYLTTCLSFFFLMNIALMVWNLLFRAYSENNNFIFDVFRGSFCNFHSPIYGNINNFIFIRDYWYILWKLWWPALAVSLLYMGYLNMRIKSFREKNISLNGSIFLLIFILTFSYTSGITAFTTYTAHYKDFLSAAGSFINTSDLLKNYVKAMPQLGIHSPHYPPGNILLMKLAQSKFSAFPKLLVILSCLLIPFPIQTLLKKWGFSQVECNMAMLISVICAPILVFPKMDLAPITMFFSAISITFFQAMIDEETQVRNAINFGLSMAIAFFFSFTSIFIYFFLLCYTCLLLHKRQGSLKSIIKKNILAIAIFTAFYLMLYLLTDFNMLACFMEAMAHRGRIPGYKAFDDVSRYLLRSTGNILPFLFLAGAPILTLFILNIKKELGHATRSFRIALILTLLFSGFSGAFFMETERLWVMYIPPMIAIAAIELAKIYQSKDYFTFIFLFALGLIHSVISELLIDHSFGYFI